VEQTTLGLVKFSRVNKMELGIGMGFMFMSRNCTSQLVYVYCQEYRVQSIMSFVSCICKEPPKKLMRVVAKIAVM
jgi:hypothetical protein